MICHPVLKCQGRTTTHPGDAAGQVDATLVEKWAASELDAGHVYRNA